MRQNQGVGYYINSWVSPVINNEYIFLGNMLWNVKHATLSSFEE